MDQREDQIAEPTAEVERISVARPPSPVSGDGHIPQATLHASEESYRNLFELAGDALFLLDAWTGEILDANKQARELYGGSLDELQAAGISGISDGDPPFDEEHARAHVRRAAEGEPQRFEWLVRGRIGPRSWVDVSLQRVRAQGSIRVLASVRSIDAQKEAEVALRKAHTALQQDVELHLAELAERTAERDQAERRFRAMVEASPTPLLLSRVEDGLVLYANDRLEALLGIPPGSLVGQRTPDFYYHPDQRPRVLEALRRDGFLRDWELYIKRADGSPCWVSLSAQLLTFDGSPAVASALVDITERKQTEAALRASEESYRGLFDNLTELVYIQDLEGRFLAVNEVVVRSYGYAREEVIGRTPEFLADPERVDVEATMRAFGRAVQGEPQRFVWWGKRKDGTTFPKEVVLNRSTYFGQDVVLAVARDVSDRVAAETALKRSEEHFRRLIENATDLISILDSDGGILYQSPAITRILGYDPAELLGRNVVEFLAPEDVEPTMQRLSRVVESPGTPITAEFRFRHKDGSWRYIESSGATLSPYSADEGVVVNSRDVTERREAERVLRFQKTLLEAQGEASIDGILVVSDEGKILSYNARFVDLWQIPPEVVASQADEAAIEWVRSKVADPATFTERIAYLYANPKEVARDEIVLKNGCVFDRYSAPVVDVEGHYYGRIWFFRDMTNQKRHAEELEQARQEASHYAESLERELDFGRKIQQGLLPAALPEPPGWELAVRFRPVWRVAGDFYDSFELPGGRIGFLIADVSGKGVGAALFMALFQSLLRASADRVSASGGDDAISDAAVLAESIGSTNGYITRVHRHANMFASVFFGVLDPSTGALHYINAGHEPPALVGADGAIQRLNPTGPALGLMREAAYEVGEVTLAPGELLLAYTDGVTEARDERRAFFSEERMLRLLETPTSGATALLDRIEAAVVTFAGDADASDDLTMLALRREGAGE